MQKETAAIVLRNLTLPEDKQKAMSVWQRRIFEEVKVCLGIMDSNLMLPTPKLRDKFMEATGCSDHHAYDIIMIARQAVGQRTPTAKRTVREELLEMMRIEYQEAIKLTGTDRVDAVVKIANTLIRGLNLNEDEGEAFNIAQYLEENEVQFTNDPAVIGITLTEKELRLMAKVRRKYMKDMLDIEDVEAEPVDTNTEGNEEGVSA